jgi:protein O-mannosyl-transferase
MQKPLWSGQDACKERLSGGRLLICLLLAAATVAIYWRVAGYGFIGIDDNIYFGENAHVLAGLSWHNLAWAFHTTLDASWYPLSWLSFMLDAQLFGSGAAGPHLMNVVLHVANVILLFLLLERLTGSLWRSAFVAGLFALHPLHVESVAWVSERKDVLSTLFGLLTLLAYARYVQVQSPESKVQSLESGVWSLKSKLGSQPPQSPLTQHATRNTQHASGFTFHAPRYYALSLLFFVLGLLSKPMLVTLPFVMLLLDYWPLRRLGVQSPKSEVQSLESGVLSLNSKGEGQPPQSPLTHHAPHTTLHAPRSTLPVPFLPLLLEKAPFFLLSIAAGIVTIVVHEKAGAIAALGSASIAARLENAAVSYARYLGKTFWPVHLAMPYLHPKHWPLGLVGLGLVLVASLSVAALWLGRRRPYLLVGWFWFLGTLLPVIGLIQWGNQAMADRFMYVPSIGLFIALAWGLGELLAQRRLPRVAIGSAAVLILVALALRSRDQIGYWRDSETFFKHTLEVTPRNYVAYDCVGSALDHKGKHDEAMRYLVESVRLQPHYAEAQYDLGTALLQANKTDEAIRHLRAVVKYNPGFPDANINLSKALLQQGKLDEAAVYAAKAVRLDPDDPEAQYNLGTLRLMQVKLAEAVACFSEAVRLRPGYAAAHGNLGVALMRLGKAREGVAHLAVAVQLNPGNPEAHQNLGLALLQLNRPGKAAGQFAEAARLNPNAPGAQYHWAEALVREHKPEAARSHAEKARDLALAAGQPALAAKAKELLDHCR